MTASPHGTVAYVLTSDGQDVYADMNLISLWSLLEHNPGCRIVILVDSVSLEPLQRHAHPILSAEAEIQVVRCEPAVPGWRNRFVKTQLRKRVAGPLLYLDGDTLIRGNLSELFQVNAMVAGVPNHNGSGVSSEIPLTEKTILSRIGWNTDLPVYANGGVLFMNDLPETHAFCALWHKRWLESSRITGQHYDQPALNQALHESGVSFTWLDHRYNAQVHARPKTARDAIIWHIYTSDRQTTPPNRLEELIALQRKGVPSVREQVAAACAAPHPWVVRNMLDRFAISHMMSSDRILHGERWERLWLTRQYKRLAYQATRRLRAPLSKALRVRRLTSGSSE